MSAIPIRMHHGAVSVANLDESIACFLSAAGCQAYVDSGSKWTATANSKVSLAGNIDLKAIDAPAGVVIAATPSAGSSLIGIHKLASGGELDVQAGAAGGL